MQSDGFFNDKFMSWNKSEIATTANQQGMLPGP
jgi:hypothetical protein